MCKLEIDAISLADLIDLCRGDGVTQIKASALGLRGIDNSLTALENGACHSHHLSLVKVR